MLLTAHEATLRITNQKNGIKGQCIHVKCTNTKDGPIKSLARRVHHILTEGGTEHSGLYTYFHDGAERYVSDRWISDAVKDQAGEIGLYKLGYQRNDVSSHSLRAGGAMAMHLNKVHTMTIRKMGRWRSDTFLCYIHEQISAFAAGVSEQMSHEIPFRHIAGPTLQEPAPAA